MIEQVDFQGHNLIFVVGCPRSGTTWLQRLLASHPKIRTGQETHLFSSYLGPQMRAWRTELRRELHSRPGSGRGGVGLSCYLQEVEFMRILRGYMLELLKPMLRELEPDDLFLEKTPHHALFIPEIKELLPKSRIIHILRDARDVVASLLCVARTWGSNWAPNHSRHAASMWVHHVRGARESVTRLSSEEFYEVNYETLYDSTARTLGEVVKFLGLEWHDEAIEGAIRVNHVESLRSGGGTPIPLYGEVARHTGPVVKEPQSFVRKAQPGAWRTDLTIWQKLWVWYVARDTMEEVGYSWRLRDWF